MTTYDSQEEKDDVSKAEDPALTYGIANPSSLTNHKSLSDADKGYMTLEQFGELFHQKLDACYASLRGQDQ